MSKLVTIHWEKDGWIQRKIQRKFCAQSACTLKGIDWLKWIIVLEKVEKINILNSTKESRHFLKILQQILAKPDTQKGMEGCCWDWEVQCSGTDGWVSQRVIQINPLCWPSRLHMGYGFGILRCRCVANHRSGTCACRQYYWMGRYIWNGQYII